MDTRFGLNKVDDNNRTGNDIASGIIASAITEMMRMRADVVGPISDVVTTANSDHLMKIVKLSEEMLILLAPDKALSQNGMLVSMPA